MTWQWTVAVVGVAGLVGYAAGLYRGHEPAEVSKAHEASQDDRHEAKTKVVYIDRQGPVITRWRKAPAAPGCPAVDEVTQERGPVERIIKEATEIATEHKGSTRTSETSRANSPQFSVGGIGVLSPGALLGGRLEWMGGVYVQRRLVGPVWGGLVVMAGPGRAFAGLSLGVTW
jgi:hypothetical protein